MATQQEPATYHSYARSILILAILIVPSLTFSSFEMPYALPLGILVSTATLWFSELLPAPVTALLVPALIVLLGVDSPKDAFSAFGSEILFLFIGCFLLSQAMHKHGWDKRMAFLLLARTPGIDSPKVLVAAMGVFCWGLSMWISNTAAVAMIVPICLGIISVYRDSLGESATLQRFQVKLLLTCAFAGSIGGLATPIGSPPNLIALELLGARGIEITFLAWMGWALPLSAFALVLLLLMLTWLYPTRDLQLQNAKKLFAERLAGLGKISAAEIQVCAVFFLLVAMWVAPELLAIVLGKENSFVVWLGAHFSIGSSALIAAALLFILPVAGKVGLQPNLNWDDGRAIEWGTIILFGGGLALGQMLGASGVAAHLGGLIAGWSGGSFIIMALLGALFALVFSEFASNTAAAAIVIPLLLGAVGADHEQATLIALLCVCGSTFGFMLPVSTPPNAIVHGTGLVTAKDLLKAGWRFDLIGIALSALYVLVFLPLVW